MAAESPSNELGLAGVHFGDSTSLHSSLRIKAALDVCSKNFESGDTSESDRAVAALVELLSSLVDPPQSDSDDVIDESVAENALEEIYGYLSSLSSNQMVVDALSLELPKVVVKFVDFSDRCRATAHRIIDSLVASCSPRDMLSILLEALDSQIRVSKSPIYFISLLGGISKVFLCIKRRHLEQVKAALPVILNVLHASSSEYHEEEDKDSLRDLFAAAVSIGKSLQQVSEKMEGRIKEKLGAILGLYVLQNIALISRIKSTDIISSYSSLLMQLFTLLPFCGFSFSGLITGSEVSSVIDEVSNDEDDDGEFLACFSFVAHGAALTVIWGYISNEVAKAAGEQLTSVLRKIQSNRIKKWQAIGMLKPILSSIDYSWEIKSHSIDMLVSMMDGSNSEGESDNLADISTFMPSIFGSLQAIQRIMIGASDASLRKKAFSALRKIISNLPPSHRFDMLKSLATHSNSPSMIAILIDLVRVEIVAERSQKTSSENAPDVHVERKIPFWSSSALDIVELVLKPSKGGPPSFPEDSDSVLSALNLLRFILIMESTGKTSHTATGVLSERNLRKVYSEWLLPLRTLVSGICGENEKDESEMADHIICALNPVQLVLYRCIELVEENLDGSTNSFLLKISS